MTVTIKKTPGVVVVAPEVKLKVMGVDPSTYTGVVVLNGNDIVCSEVINYPDAVGFRRVQVIADAFGKLVDVWQPDAIFIEGFIYGGPFRQVLMVQIGTMLRSQLFVRGLEWWDVVPTYLKKWVTGEGHASKKFMRSMIKAKWDIDFESDDVADAFALAQVGKHVLGMGPKVQVKGVNKEKHGG